MKANVGKYGRGQIIGVIVLAGLLLVAIAALSMQKTSATLLIADRVFDGNELKKDMAVLVEEDRIKAVGSVDDLRKSGQKEIHMGDATILPGFIESHAHALFQNVPLDIVLRHGVTTIRDVGGPLRAPAGGDGSIRLLTSGPILTAAGGYPIPAFGAENIAKAVASETEAREAVRQLASDGASIIKIALEPGGEAGAPWSGSHGHHGNPGHGEDHHHTTPGSWPLMPLKTVQAIVEEAHKHGKKVTAHVGEQRGAKLALDAGVDEWSHVPCAPIPDPLLKQAGKAEVRVVTTIDTLSNCHGIAANAAKLKQFGATILYGSEVAHTDVPWGINAEELHGILHKAGMNPLDTLKAATSVAGENLGLAPLGTLVPGAPADIIAARGDATKLFKPLEYPTFVMSGGKVIVNEYTNQ